VYFSVTGARNSGGFYASPKGVVSQYGKDVPLANGIILSPDEKTLYATNGAIVYAFDVNADANLLISPCDQSDARRTAIPLIVNGQTRRNIPTEWVSDAAAEGFFWGGAFKKRFDPMHFQLATGF